MENQIQLLNPYSISLKKDPFMKVENKPVHTNGDFKIYRYCDRYFIHTFKNIVICERCAPNKEVITNLKGETKPTGEANIYFDYIRPQQAINEGIEAAKKLNFIIQ